MSFSDLQLNSSILKTLDKLEYKTPTPVQKKVIPEILKNLDLRVSAPTGTGKTAAFLLPGLTKILESQSEIKGKGPRILVLVPTRELAIQVASQAEKYSRCLQRMKTVCIYGGVPYLKQIKALKNPHEIVVATPGRLIDHLEQKRVCLDRVEMFILDEADRMLDMGFSKPVQQIAEALPKKRQTLLFSATLKGNVLDLSNKLLTNPLEINVNHDLDKQENIDQKLFYVDDVNHKQKILEHLLQDSKIEQTIVFTATKRQADKLTKFLMEEGHAVAKIHGDIHQQKRTKTIVKLRTGKVRILVATDVAARGIDVKTISHVINFDLPESNEDYVHRIGRTARAGARGTSYSFATNKERNEIFSIEKFTGKKMTCETIKGLEPKKKLSSKTVSPKKKSHYNKKRKPFFSKKNNFKRKRKARR